MAPQVQRHVRRAPLKERLRAYLHPSDVLLWLSEEYASNDWEGFSRKWSTTIGLILNALLVFARSSSVRTSTGDEIFEDYHQGVGGYFASLCSLLAYSVASISFLNAVLTLTNTKSYRLFHADPEGPAPTPTARKVKVDSSPASSLALSLLTNLFPSSLPRPFAGSQDSEEVWEISIWDPPALSLRLFALFSPANVFITWLFLPASSTLEQRASVTIAQTIALCALISLQGSLLQSFFLRQSKDTSSINREVAKEYDIKYVQPNAEKRAVRDVGTQLPHDAVWNKHKNQWEAVPEVVSSSAYVSPRIFRTYANPSSASAYKPKAQVPPTAEGYYRPLENQPLVTPHFQNNQMPHLSNNHYSTAPDLFSSPVRNIQSFTPFPTQKKQPQYSSKGTGNGGSLGIYTNDRSPLRKATSANALRRGPADEVRRREGSPLKRASTPAGGLHQRSLPRDDLGRRDSGRY